MNTTMGEYLLRVSVLSGRALAPKDSNGLSNPYIIVNVADASGNFAAKNHKRSEVRYFTLNPTWEKASFSFDPDVKQLRIEVWDENKDKEHNFMGFFVLKTDFASTEAQDLWVKVLPRIDAERDKVCGEINVVASRGHKSNIHPSILFNRKNNMVRVFFSSTFTDMAEERQIIMRKVMVELKKFCYDRGVSLTYIDMRWGIPTEMVENGQTIIRCLQEIDHSRPYFVGTIAQRYGWNQEKDGTSELLSKTFSVAEQEYPWVNAYRTRSVTEVEILHGFLLNPALPKGHTFFYFRDPQYLEHVRSTKQDMTRFEDTDPYAISSLAKLKDDITKKAQTGDCVLQNYTKPADLEEMMIKDLKAAIERDFPIKTSDENSVAKYFHDHENFSQSLCSGYVPNKSYFDALNAIATSNGTYLLVAADSGSGKSALLANWWNQQKSLKAFFFVHFVGASSLASSFHGLIIRLFETINSRLAAHERVPIPREDELVATIPKFLTAISLRGGITIVIDAANQLPEQFHDLLWLPLALPQKVNVIISSLPCKITQAAEKRKWAQLAVVPLQASEKEILIKSKLDLFGKIITDAQLKPLVGHPLSSIPLFLSTALSELCIIGYSRALKDQLQAIVNCNSLSELFQLVLTRLEEGFGKELTTEVMQLIVVSRQGLLEATAQTVTGANPINLFPLLSATRNFLVINRGKLTFSHAYLREAVYKRYLAASRAVAQRKLIEYWKTSPFDSNTAYELPWLIAELLVSLENKTPADTQKELAELLLNLNNFKILFAKPELQLDLHKYWRTLEATDAKWNRGPLYVKEVSKATSEQGFIVISVSKFLLQTSLLPSALEVAEKALAIFEKAQPPKRGDIADALNNIGDILCEQGELEKAADKLNESYKLRVQQFGEFHPSVAQSLGSIGLLRFQQGKHSEALEKFKKALEILKKGKNQREIAKTLHNIAAIYQEQDNYTEALKVMEEALTTLKSVLGELHPEVATAISNLAILLHAKGDNAEAKILHRQALDMRVALFGSNHLDVAHSFYSFGEFLFETKEISSGISTAVSAIDVQLKLLGPSHPQLGDTLSTIANMNYEAEMVPDAVRYAKEALSVKLEQQEKDEEEIKQLLGILAGGLSKLNKPDEARRFNVSAFNKTEFKANFKSTL